MIHVALIDDNLGFLKAITFCLAQQSFRVTPLSQGKGVMEKLHDLPIDMVLLDRFLPDMDGFELCSNIKAVYPDMPIIMFSSAGEAQDVIDGLTVGADDYLPKPFVPEMLIAKIQAVNRRYRQTKAEVPDSLQLGPLEVRRSTRAVLLSGTPLKLTKSEYRIVEVLAERPGVVLDREEILQKAFGYPEDADYLASNLGFHITAIRKKFGPHRNLIQTVRGFGFRLRCKD